MSTEIARMRNIGISAHIDSGKTTLTERILFYCKKIHAIHEVKGKDGVGATMDSMDLERERGHHDRLGHDQRRPGTTIPSTSSTRPATSTSRSRSSAPCGSSTGPSSSSARSAASSPRRSRSTASSERYNVPCIAFINKFDRVGANPSKVRDQIAEKLGHNAVLMQIPIGLEDGFEGIVDLVTMKALYFDGPDGDDRPGRAESRQNSRPRRGKRGRRCSTPSPCSRTSSWRPPSTDGPPRP